MALGAGGLKGGEGFVLFKSSVHWLAVALGHRSVPMGVNSANSEAPSLPCSEYVMDPVWVWVCGFTPLTTCGR